MPSHPLKAISLSIATLLAAPVAIHAEPAPAAIPAQPGPSATPVPADPAASAQPAAQQLLRLRNCQACHTETRKLIGPAYRDVASRYREDGLASQRLAQKIRDGSRGSWGAVPMPPNPAVSEDEAAALAQWVLSR